MRKLKSCVLLSLAIQFGTGTSEETDVSGRLCSLFSVRVLAPTHLVTGPSERLPLQPAALKELCSLSLTCQPLDQSTCVPYNLHTSAGVIEK